MSDSIQSNETSVEQVKRAENIQIVIATATISAYVALLGRNILPNNFFSDLFFGSVVFSSIFLILKMTALTTLVYRTEVETNKTSSSFDAYLLKIGSLWGYLPGPESEGLSSVSQIVRWANRTVVPLLYALLLWIILIYIPFFTITKLAPKQLVVNILQLTSNLLFQVTFTLVSAPIVIIMAARFLLGYRATMAQIETGSVPGPIFVASGPSGSDTELLIKSSSESKKYKNTDIRLEVDRPSSVAVDIDPAELVEDDVWMPKHDLPAGERMILGVNIQRECSDTTSGDEVAISVLLDGDLQMTETYTLDL